MPGSEGTKNGTKWFPVGVAIVPVRLIKGPLCGRWYIAFFFCCIAFHSDRCLLFLETMLSPFKQKYQPAAIPSEAPSDACVQACRSRPFLIVPDRRSFVQSMGEASRGIQGNVVPAGSERQHYAYTFPRNSSTGEVLPSSSYYHREVLGSSPVPRGSGTPVGGSSSRRSANFSRQGIEDEYVVGVNSRSDALYGTPMDTRSRNGPR